MNNKKLFDSATWSVESKSITIFIKESDKILHQMASMLEHREKVLGDRGRFYYAKYAFLLALVGLVFGYGAARDSLLHLKRDVFSIVDAVARLFGPT